MTMKQRDDGVGFSISDTVIQSVAGLNLFTARDAYFLSRQRMAELKMNQVVASLRYMCDQGRVVKIPYHPRRNVYCLALSAQEAKETISRMELSILRALQEFELVFSGNLALLGREMGVARSAAFVVLRRLSEDGRIFQAKGISYKGKTFTFYFALEKKDLFEERLVQVSDYIKKNILVYSSNVAEDLDLDPSTVRCLLAHLSYIGQINQIHSIRGHPFSLPGHAAEIERLSALKLK